MITFRFNLCHYHLKNFSTKKNHNLVLVILEYLLKKKSNLQLLFYSQMKIQQSHLTQKDIGWHLVEGKTAVLFLSLQKCQELGLFQYIIKQQ